MRRIDMQALHNLDNSLRSLAPLSAIERPLAGWIVSIREALGMNRRQLAGRMKIAEERVAGIEQGEVSGEATLYEMGEAAKALNCRFVYALVPIETLEQSVRQQARTVATARVNYVNHQMRLEGQQLDDDGFKQLIEDDVNETLNEHAHTLWDKSE